MTRDAHFNPTAYLQAALQLHGLVLDAARREEVETQFRLLTGMAEIVAQRPLPADVEPANIFRP